MKTNKPITMKTKHALCGLLSGLLLLAAGTAQTHAGLLVPATPGAQLYVANSGTNTIEKFTPGGVGSVFASTCLSGPAGLAFDSAGNLFVANYGNSTIREFSSAGADLGVFADAADGLANPTYLAFGLVTPVPEPGTALFGIACVGVAALRRRRSAAVAAKLTA